MVYISLPRPSPTSPSCDLRPWRRKRCEVSLQSLSEGLENCKFFFLRSSKSSQFLFFSTIMKTQRNFPRSVFLRAPATCSSSRSVFVGAFATCFWRHSQRVFGSQQQLFGAAGIGNNVLGRVSTDFRYLRTVLRVACGTLSSYSCTGTLGRRSSTQWVAGIRKGFCKRSGRENVCREELLEVCRAWWE